MPTTCWSCGSSYDASTCPRCETKALLERPIDATERASRERAEAEADATAPLLQSERLAEQAAGLLKAGLLDAAEHHARHAAELDRGNLAAQRVLSGALSGQGRSEEAVAGYRRCIHLLEIGDYRTSPDAFARVLDGLPVDPDLHRLFLDTLSRCHAGFVGEFEGCLSLVDVLAKRQLLPAAVLLVRSLAARFTNRLLPQVCLQRIFRLSGLDTTIVARWLETVPAKERGEVLRDLGVLRRVPLLATEFETVRHAVEARYEGWRPEIEGGFRASARDTAEAKAARDDVIPWLGAGVGVLVFLAVAGSIVAGSPGATAGAVTMGLLFAVPAGFGATWFLRLSRADRLAEGEYWKLADGEADAWSILGDRAEGREPVHRGATGSARRAAAPLPVKAAGAAASHDGVRELGPRF
jgi:hypothetical protein